MNSTTFPSPGTGEPQLAPSAPPTLEYLEGVITRGLHHLEEVAGALLQINESRLYLKEYPSFGAYLNGRWQMSRARGYQLLHFARVKQMSTVVDTGAPKNERQARQLDPKGNKRPPKDKNPEEKEPLREDDDPITMAMDYVATVYEKLTPLDQRELLKEMRNMLNELEGILNGQPRVLVIG